MVARGISQPSGGRRGRPSCEGRVADIVTKGRLAYTIRWRMHVMEVVRPERIVVTASGDLVGEGRWTLAAMGPDGSRTTLGQWT